MTERTLWCNPALGVAGDMWMAALIDAGADEQFVRTQLDSLALAGWRLDLSPTTRRGLVAVRADVQTEEQHHHRSWSSIDELLGSSSLDPAVADGARRTFRALGEAEARVHGVSIDEVHFHEVGALDAIVDIVGSWAAVVSLDVGRVVVAPVGLGSGTAPMAHGTVPVPAPAVLELLVGHPTVPVAHAGETATPTGVALLVTMATDWGPAPAGTIVAVGRGAGTLDPPTHPNVVTAVVSASSGAVAEGAAEDDPIQAVVIETNVDDVTPEVLGHLIELALGRGADDAWVTPILMKKGRPAHQLSVLCRPALSDTLREVVMSETGTLGVRVRLLDKYESPRRIASVELDGHRVRIKVGPYGAKPEHDDVVAAAAATGRTLRSVAADALSRWDDDERDTV